MKRITDIPILMFSGEKDDLALSTEVQHLFDQCPAPTAGWFSCPTRGMSRPQPFGQFHEIGTGFPKDVRVGFPEPRSPS